MAEALLQREESVKNFITNNWPWLILLVLLAIPIIHLSFDNGWGVAWDGLRDFVRAWQDM